MPADPNPDPKRTGVRGRRGAVADSPVADFFLWWWQELGALFTGSDTGSGARGSVSVLLAEKRVDIARSGTSQTNKVLASEPGSPATLSSSSKLLKKLENAESIELLADEGLATLNSFVLAKSDGVSADDLVQQVRQALPSGGSGLEVAVRIRTTDSGATALDFGTVPKAVVDPWREAGEKAGAITRFGGIRDSRGLLPPVTPSGKAPLPARAEDIETVPRASFLDGWLGLGLAACVILLCGAFYLHQLNEITALEKQASGARDLVTETAALEAANERLRHHRDWLARHEAPYKTLEDAAKAAGMTPGTSQLAVLDASPARTLLEGTTSNRNALLAAFTDQPGVASAAFTDVAEGAEAPRRGPFVLEVVFSAIEVAPEQDAAGEEAP